MGFTNEEAASSGVVCSSIKRQLFAGMHRYWLYIPPPANPTVFPIIPFAPGPASTITPEPSLPKGINWLSLGCRGAINFVFNLILVLVFCLSPEVSISERSAAWLKSLPKSDGLIGAASIRTKTSFSCGLGIGVSIIEISI